MGKRVLWRIAATLAVIIGLYPGLYFVLNRQFGLLASKSPALLQNISWNAGFYTHILLGGLALLIGWVQFSTRIQQQRPGMHRLIGKIYVVSVLLSAAAGIGIAFVATGGIIAASGFMALGIIWFSTTLMGYVTIRKGAVRAHKQLMTYSYAACFAAVTLRLWLPLLMVITGTFGTAYQIVAWLCWVPNMAVAYFLLRKSSGDTYAVSNV